MIVYRALLIMEMIICNSIIWTSKTKKEFVLNNNDNDNDNDNVEFKKYHGVRPLPTYRCLGIRGNWIIARKNLLTAQMSASNELVLIWNTCSKRSTYHWQLKLKKNFFNFFTNFLYYSGCFGYDWRGNDQFLERQTIWSVQLISTFWISKTAPSCVLPIPWFGLPK